MKVTSYSEDLTPLALCFGFHGSELILIKNDVCLTEILKTIAYNVFKNFAEVNKRRN